MRIDKWLWAARFFKTRALASEAVKHGQILCNGVRPKPSRLLKAGDMLVVRRSEQRFVIQVLLLSGQRGPASKAQLLYRETDESREQRERVAAERRTARMSAPQAPAARPDKHARQRIRRLLGK